MSERIKDEDGNVIIRCAGIVRKSEKILLVKSTYDGEPYWIFPGGGLNPEKASENVQKERFRRRQAWKLMLTNSFLSTKTVQMMNL